MMASGSIHKCKECGKDMRVLGDRRTMQCATCGGDTEYVRDYVQGNEPDVLGGAFKKIEPEDMNFGKGPKQPTPQHEDPQEHGKKVCSVCAGNKMMIKRHQKPWGKKRPYTYWCGRCGAYSLGGVDGEMGEDDYFRQIWSEANRGKR